MQVGLGPGHIVLGGDPASPPLKGHSPPPNFRPMSIVAHAMRQTASHKATGPDDVPAELFKAGGDSTGQNAQNMCGDLGNS